jgi:hypothetical protein
VLGALFLLVFVSAWYAGRQMRDTPPSIAVEHEPVVTDQAPIPTEPPGPSPIRPAQPEAEGGAP